MSVHIHTQAHTHAYTLAHLLFGANANLAQSPDLFTIDISRAAQNSNFLHTGTKHPTVTL